ncbi:DUF1501 domain-containing protein [Alienimonas californiensis]|uniref:Sulfatase n=1 Tax=Alienimonas californiensis TaxID=2527989 RepID=A0A517P4I2_9PLAN|nr:DUF1501 domain-containing protein [Alienimonas californiensis]QDT14271.1 hypothetical protein CA12_03420 [Alienimonas californiensis]
MTAPRLTTRRNFFQDAACGVGAIALADLLARDGKLTSAAEPQARPGLHHEPKAKQLIHIFLGGGLSHVDSFDYKPELETLHDKEMPDSFGTADVFNGKVGRLHRSHYRFAQRGRSGLWVSDLFPGIAEVADELTVIRSMTAETANHIPGIFQANTGFRQMGFPTMGAWLSYGLGTENENLPSFVVLPDSRGIPNAAGGAFNWSAGFLPAEHQGVPFNTRGGPPILDLNPAGGASDEVQQARLELLGALNELHMQEQAETDPLVARIHSYELAARMQRTIPEAMELASEPKHVQKLYGIDRNECRDVGRNCLAARRLIQRGVRTVQIWTGDGVSWDAHDDVTGKGYKSHTGEALRVDRPIAGLIQDLRAQGMLDSTLVMLTTEFGRTPFAQASKGTLSRGRDHHPQGFTNVLVGAGLKPGYAYGATDELGYAAVENPVTTYDMHATILHLLGIDHERLTFYHNGIERRLTNVHGHVIKDILA